MCHELAPFRIAALKLRACSVIELPAGTLAKTRTSVGDELELNEIATEGGASMRHRSSLVLVLVVAMIVPGCAHRRRATGSLYPVADLVGLAAESTPIANNQTPGSQSTLSDFVRSVLKLSQENTVAAADAVKRLHERRSDLAALSTRATANPADVEARRVLAEAYMDEGLLPYAFQMYREIQSTKPNDWKAEAGVALVWDKWGDYALAKQHAERAVFLEPGSVRALELLGSVLLHRNELDAALSAFLSAIQIKPQDSSLLNNAGYIFLKRGDLLQARLYLEQAVAIERFSHTSTQQPRNHTGTNGRPRTCNSRVHGG